MVDFFISKSIETCPEYIHRAPSCTQSLAAPTQSHVEGNATFRQGDQSNSRLQGGGLQRVASLWKTATTNRVATLSTLAALLGSDSGQGVKSHGLRDVAALRQTSTAEGRSMRGRKTALRRTVEVWYCSFRAHRPKTMKSYHLTYLM
jgi:hypothetical protein